VTDSSGRLTGQVAVVTGASSGVGRAVARELGERGVRVALLARNREALENAAREIANAGGEALVLPTDVSDAQAVEQAASAVEAKWGQIDLWVNVAMVTVVAKAVDITPQEYRRVTEVTYLGYVYGTLAALKRMRPRGRGTIVQVGSALAYRSIPLQAAYCASKAAIRGFTDSLRSELIREKSGIRLTHVHLPAVNTPQSLRQRNKMNRQQQPVPPQFSPEAVAEAIVWAAERAPREMLVGGPTVQAVYGELGLRLLGLSGWLDRYLARAAWEPQFVNEPNKQPGDILDATLPGDPGAHGPYREGERKADLQIKLRMRPRTAAALAGAAVLGAAFTLVRRR
jgi:NADP-dependent 3-hydroxy acid dehydrogenase YdfG